jgi:hypothetical protein
LFRLNIEKKTIKSFEASVFIEFSGKWKEAPYPVWLQPSSPTTYLKWSDKNKRLPDIEFRTERIHYKTINENTGVFENILTVQPGNAPLGKIIDNLSEYNQMSFWFLITNPKDLTDPHIVIKKVRIKFLINGSIKGELIDNNIVINLSEDIRKAEAGINPTLSLEGNLVDLLKISLK